MSAALSSMGTMGDALKASAPATSATPAATTPAETPDKPDDSGLRDTAWRSKLETEGAVNRLKDADAHSAALVPPQMQTPPKPPEQKDTPIAERWGSMAMLLAGFGGLLTRQPLTTSLNAMAAVNHAYNEGDAAAQKSAFDQWKVQNDNAVKMSEFAVKAYDSALKQISSDRAGALAELRATAAAFKDNVFLNLLDSGQTDRALGLIPGMKHAQGAMSARGEELQIAHERIQADQAANPNRDRQEQLKRNMLILQGKDPDDTKGEFSKTQPVELEITGEDGTKQKVPADRDNKTGGWVTADENRTPLHAVAGGGFRIVPKGESSIDLSPEGKAYAATVYRRTGKLPQGYGAASAAVRTEIINMAGAASSKEGGGAADDLTTQADIHAESQALTTLARTRANVTNFEETANKESDLVLSLLDNGAGGGVPLINRWIQGGRQNIEGDADVSKMNAALISFKNEYARIMSSPGASGGVTSDAARNEASELINKSMTPDQIKGVIQTMKKGMQNRIDAINEAYEATRKRLRDVGPPARGAELRRDSASPAATALPAAAVSRLTEGHITTFANGQSWTLRDGKPEQVQDGR